ncbi:putative F-box domain-containing protein [Helianthus annuus]|uniref:F-box domain-containing protein n=1 Tax=Helianthus annuus TaxID=4232 RepID=A0A251UXE5_HELAN|nr:putative F-box domain-containing protein [Helianthus annuus]
MSNNIPLEIQTEIMKRLPVKSLLRFRSVSKSWYVNTGADPAWYKGKTPLRLGASVVVLN